MKKVLIITYYWPPSGGSGVQRWLKFVKYLPEFGYEPHVIVPENPDFDIADNSFEKDIPKEAVLVKRKIFEPYKIYNFIFGKKKTEGANFGLTNTKKNSLKHRFVLSIRNNLFFPDPRFLWVRPTTSFLKQYIKENDIGIIVTTGPPHSMHLIGLKLKYFFKDKIKWITDFRDPWTKMFNIHEFGISDRIFKKLEKKEKEVLENCDKFITVSNTWKAEFEELGGRGKGNCIYNGVDLEDYKYNNRKKIKNKKFTLSYIGLLPKLSNPIMLWKSLSELISENTNFKNQIKIVLIGKIDPEVVQSIKDAGILQYCDFKGIVSHEEAVEYQLNTDLLLLLIPNVSNSKGILTGKVYEYMATKNQILALGKEDDEVGNVLKQTNTGQLFTYKSNELLKKYLLKNLSIYENGIIVKTNNINEFTRKNLTKQLASLLDSL